MLKFYNTLTRKKEVFKPIKDKKVGLYTCGPTVYDYSHIGNLRTYIFEDILLRVLEYNDYQIKHIMNITDVGHLTSDADTGEDKIELGAKRERKTAWQIVKFYTDAFKKDIKRLNIQSPFLWAQATDHIKEQIELIKILEKKGFTYKIADGIYFDTSKLKTYGRLWPKKMKLKAGARVKMVPGKKNPTDFALWKFTPLGVKRQMEWNSPWGRGFPGWHIECSAMAMKYLGKTFDIHTGAIDHIPIHHTNEIAQSEAAFGKILANYWLHAEFLLINNSRMGKSEGNLVTLQTLIDKGFNPLAFRYLCLTTHYRSKLNFTWKSMEAAQNALDAVYQTFSSLKNWGPCPSLKDWGPGFSQEQRSSAVKSKSQKYQKKFLEAVNDDLNTPKALAIVWDLLKNTKVSEADKKQTLLDFDKVLGLKLSKIKKLKIPENILMLAQEREKLRKEKKWPEADEIRKRVEQAGYQIEDTKQGPKIIKK